MPLDPHPTVCRLLAALAVALAWAGPARAQDDTEAAGAVEAMSYDFLLAISEPEDFDAESDPDAAPDVGAVALRQLGAAAEGPAGSAPAAVPAPADVPAVAATTAPPTPASRRDVALGAVDYQVAIRVAEGFDEAVILDEIADANVEVIVPPVDLPMVDLASGATMYRLLGDDAAAAIWYARLVEVSDDPINYFFYARALRTLGHDDLADEYTARYAEARRRT